MRTALIVQHQAVSAGAAAGDIPRATTTWSASSRSARFARAGGRTLNVTFVHVTVAVESAIYVTSLHVSAIGVAVSPVPAVTTTAAVGKPQSTGLTATLSV